MSAVLIQEGLDLLVPRESEMYKKHSGIRILPE